MSSKDFSSEIEKFDKPVRDMFMKAWIVASSGILTLYYDMTFDDQVLMNFINSCGVSVNKHKKRIDWGFSTGGIGKLLRDQTYKCIKESIYPSMKVLAEKGDYTYILESNKWLVDCDKLLLCGSEYFTTDGFECLIETQFIVGFSWRYASKGYAQTLRQTAELGFLNTYLPFLKCKLEESDKKCVEIPSDIIGKFTPHMVKYLKDKERILLDNDKFYKGSGFIASEQCESDQNQTNDSKQLHAMETDKS